MGRKLANMDTFLRRLDAEAPMGPLCGASKARAAPCGGGGRWGRNSPEFCPFSPLVTVEQVNR